MRVLVTGANGFVGRHAVAKLQAMGHSVVAVDRGSARMSGCETVNVDLLSRGAAEAVARSVSVDALLHLAWTTRHGIYWNDLDNLQWLAATVELVAAVARRGTHRICVTGTCFEYDWPRDGDCDEFATPIALHTLYDAAKGSCRRVLEQLTREMHLSFAWCRLFHLYGPDEHPERLVASVCKSLVAGETARCSSGAALRDFMDVRDAGAALAHVVASDVQGVINIASGEAVRIRDVAMSLGTIAGRPDLIAIGVLPDRPADPPRITASTRRLNREVKFQAAHPLKNGLGDALTFWSERRE